MGTPVSLFIVVLLCISFRPLSSQEVATDSPTPTDMPAAAAATDASVEAAGQSTDAIEELQTAPPAAEPTTDTDTDASVVVTTPLSLPESTSEAALVPETTPAQALEQATTLHTMGISPEPQTTTTEGPTTVAALEQTPPETTTIPPGTTVAHLDEAQTTESMVEQTTSLSTVVPPTTTSPIIPPPLPTTPAIAIKQASSPPTSTQATTVDDTAEVTTTPPPPPIAAVTPLVLTSTSPIIPVPNPDISSEGPADSTHGASVTPFAVGAPPTTDNDQSNIPIWVWIMVVALVAMLVGAVCITLLVQRRKKRDGHGFARTSVNGRSQRSKKKKGEEDVWAGPVMMPGEGDDCEGKGGGDGDVELNGAPVEGTQPMLSSFAPSDEEKAVGAEGTKEVRRWSEQSPLLYIDEDAVEEEGSPKEQPPASTQDGVSAGKTQAEGPGQQENGEVFEQAGEPLNGAVAFCQTTAV